MNLVEGFIIEDNRIIVSHLQFVDDTILFLNVNRANICDVELCIKIFEITSGLKINMEKYCMVGL